MFQSIFEVFFDLETLGIIIYGFILGMALACLHDYYFYESINNKPEVVRLVKEKLEQEINEMKIVLKKAKLKLKFIEEKYKL